MTSKDEEWKIVDTESAYNLIIPFGGKDGMSMGLKVQRTLLNRFRYWMLCSFFPFKIERWGKS